MGADEDAEPDDDELRVDAGPGRDTFREVGNQVMQRLFGKSAEEVRRFGRYEVVRRLGAGAMGTVYLARDPDLRREVAIKVLHGSLADQQRTILVVEARAMAQVNHPNLVAVYDVGEHEGDIFIAMERVEGVTLRQWAEARPRGWREVAAIFRDAALGLAAAHETEVIHRDFKPDNALVDERGRITVLDFGLAKYNESPEQRAVASLASGGAELPASELEATASVAGTPAYMAPEVIGGRDSNPASDQFSFGISLYECLCGRRPFVATTVAALLTQIHEGRREPRPAGVRVPANVWRVVERCLEQDPQQRYPSMAAVAAALGRSLVPLRRRLLVPGIAFGIVGGGALGVYGYASLQRSECEREVESIDAVWSPSARGDVEVALGDADGASEALAEIDTWVESWRAGRANACEHQANDAWVERRHDCYAGQLIRLDGLVSVLSDVEGDAVANAGRAVGRLPDVERCADDVWLARAVPPPPEAAVEDAVNAARGELARVITLRDMGQFAEATEIAVAQVDVAEALGYLPLQAEAITLRGRMHDDAGELEDALSTYERSFAIATEIDAPLIATQAAIRMAEILAARLRRPREGLIWAELSAGYLARLGEAGRTLGVHRGKMIARIHADLGQYEEALQLIRATQAEARDFLEPSAPILTSLMGEEAWILSRLGDFDQAIELGRAAVQREEERLGAVHPSLEPLLTNLMIFHAQSQKFEKALPLVERLVALNVELYGENDPRSATARLSMGNIYAELGDFDRAFDLANGARALLEAKLGPEHMISINSLMSLAEYEERRGNFEQGLEHAREAVDRLERSGQTARENYTSAKATLAKLQAGLDAQRREREAPGHGKLDPR